MSASSTSTAYCYDNADRLTSDTVSSPVSGADPIAGTSLVSTGATPNLTYDGHGNTTTLADQSMGYDMSSRHMSTVTVAGSGTSVVYQRDVLDRIVSATTTVGTGTPTTDYYSFNDDGSAADWTFTAVGSGTVLDHIYALPGGVSMDVQLANTTTAWSYPDIHGDDTVTTNAVGTRTGVLALYDPFGDPIDPTTHLIGSTTADDAVPDDTKSTGSQSFGWEGSHGKLYQHASDIAVIEMGARQYVPLLGRFLSVDPVPGGNANDYNYPDDPVNGADITGLDEGYGEGADGGFPEGGSVPPPSITASESHLYGDEFAEVFGIATSKQKKAIQEAQAEEPAPEIAESNAKHMFGNRKGHITDTPENREIIRNSVRAKYLTREVPITKGKLGTLYIYERPLSGGRVAWAEVFYGEITNGGIDMPRRRIQ